MQGLETDSATIGQPPHRFEVITGEAGRRSHDDGFKGRLVALTLASGSCVADVARAHGIHPQLLYTWRRQAKTGKLVLPALDAPEFAPVVIDDDVPVPPSQAPVPDSETSAIVIEFDGVMVRLGGSTSASRIAEIAAALRNTR